MKTWIYAGFACLLLVAVLPMSVLAQSQRYPTDAELQRLRQELRQKIPQLNTTGIYHDRRSPNERRTRNAFVEAWAKVDPAIAPFLGEWSAIEESLYIYPSKTRGTVCILDISLDIGDFYTGQIRNGKVYTASNLVFFLDSGFLSNAFVSENKPGTYEYANPRPLPGSLQKLQQYYPDMIAAFEKADCFTGLPKPTSK